MAEQNGPKKRGRKKGTKMKPRVKAVKRIPRGLDGLSFEQLQELSIKINELMKSKKDEQIKLLRQKLAELENL